MIFVLIIIRFSCAKSPVLLIPGFGGSQLLYKENSSSTWELLWEVDPQRLEPDRIDEYVNQLKVVYDSNTEEYSSSAYVYDVIVKDWGSVAGIDTLNPSGSDKSMHDLIEALKSVGYVDEVDLFGAPFDFRLESYKGVQKPGRLFAKVQILIEKMFTTNNKPIVLVSLSQGSCIIRHFLANYVDQAWKDRHIKAWVSVSGSFAGNPWTFLSLITCIQDPKEHEATEYFAAAHWMLPNGRAYPADYILANVTGSGPVIAVGNMSGSFDLPYHGRLKDPAVSSLNAINAEFNPPNVELYVYYGTSIPTMSRIEYTAAEGKDWWECGATMVDTNVDGDGAVPLESLLAPHLWDDTNNKPMHFIPIPNTGHVEVSYSTQFIQDVLRIVTDDESSESKKDKGRYRNYIGIIVGSIGATVGAIVVVVVVVVSVVALRKCGREKYTGIV